MRRAAKVYDVEHAEVDFVPKHGDDGGDDVCMLITRYQRSKTPYER